MILDDPASITPEAIAIALDAAGWLTIAAPEAETPESLAIALEAAGYHDFDDPTAETAESVAIVINALPDAVDLDANSAGATTLVNIRWRRVPLATGYKLYRDTVNAPTTLRATYGDVTSAIDAGTQNTVYFYRMRATNDTGMGPYSNEETAAPKVAPTFAGTSAHDHERVF